MYDMQQSQHSKDVPSSEIRRLCRFGPICSVRAGAIRAVLLGLIGLASTGIVAANPDRVAEPVYGAGPSTAIVKLFFEHFNNRPEAKGKAFFVPERSVKHAGGVRASGNHLFGRTGRPLSQKEKAKNKFEIVLGKIPVGFVTAAAVKLPPLSPSDINALFSGQVKNWKTLGGPDASVVLVGREKSEAVLTAMSEQFPILLNADYQKIFKRDHAVVNFLKTPAGRHAVAYGALSNFDGLNRVELVNVQLGVEVGLVVDRRNADHPLVEAVQEYAASMDWHLIASDAGYIATELDPPIAANSTLRNER